ncbi:MAG TPA: 5-(carboxyamino)imidazole ribonucleotide synthase, partial [Hyphomicrobiaceae bacterium]|nr:5-(carboxyamino)imidazole ribonucleotide synthase [Hyphomicrobiaceae bacterium]
MISEPSATATNRLATLPPGSTIGILGGGQLGRMLAMAAAKLGLKAHIYTDKPDSPAAEVSSRFTLGAFDDHDALGRFAEEVDVVTYEFENVPVAAAHRIEGVVPVRPGPRALAVAQDRLAEKQFLRDAQIPVAPFASVTDRASLDAAIRTIGTPAILKTRFLGYDGKGQARIHAPSDAAAAWESIGQQPAVLEGYVPFAFEISILAVRGRKPGTDGETTLGETYYDCPLNSHEHGILRRSAVPAPITLDDTLAARSIARRILTQLDYVGVLAVEFFHMGAQHKGDSKLVVNEIAPRVHNSGHWTMDACAIDQFENHIRAVAGWPSGSTARHSDVEMLNLIGSEIDDWCSRISTAPATSLHIYGKSEALEGRKMGHINI